MNYTVENELQAVPKIKVLSAPWQQAKGMMFKKKAEPLLFIFRKPCRPLFHFFFCPVMDVLAFDESLCVVDLLQNACAPGLFRPCRPCVAILELPSGWVERNGVRVGDSFSV